VAKGRCSQAPNPTSERRRVRLLPRDALEAVLVREPYMLPPLESIEGKWEVWPAVEWEQHPTPQGARVCGGVGQLAPHARLSKTPLV
jgi:hypothetical protein